MRSTKEAPSILSSCKCSDFSSASAMFMLMHRLNADYNLDKPYDEINNRKGLVATYIYLLTDKLIRKHTQEYLRQFPNQTKGVLVNMPDDEIISSAVRDINKLPLEFTESLESLVWSIDTSSTQKWDKHIFTHVDEWSRKTDIFPMELGLIAT